MTRYQLLILIIQLSCTLLSAGSTVVEDPISEHDKFIGKNPNSGRAQAREGKTEDWKKLYSTIRDYLEVDLAAKYLTSVKVSEEKEVQIFLTNPRTGKSDEEPYMSFAPSVNPEEAKEEILYFLLRSEIIHPTQNQNLTGALPRFARYDKIVKGILGEEYSIGLETRLRHPFYLDYFTLYRNGTLVTSAGIDTYPRRAPNQSRFKSEEEFEKFIRQVSLRIPKRPSEANAR